MIKNSENSPNSKFAMSLQCLKKELRDKVDCLHADKHQSFLQSDDLIIEEHGQVFLKHSK